MSPLLLLQRNTTDHVTSTYMYVILSPRKVFHVSISAITSQAPSQSALTPVQWHTLPDTPCTWMVCCPCSPWITTGSWAIALCSILSTVRVLLRVSWSSRSFGPTFYNLLLELSIYRIPENFQGRKSLQISRFCDYSRVFSMQFEGMASYGGTSEQSAKVFSMKIFFSLICESFLPRKFPAVQQFLPNLL